MQEFYYSTSMVCKECDVSTRQLYYWELIGLITPDYEPFGQRKFRRYTNAHIGKLKKAKALLDEGFTLQAVCKTLGSVSKEEAEEVQESEALSEQTRGLNT